MTRNHAMRSPWRPGLQQVSMQQLRCSSLPTFIISPRCLHVGGWFLKLSFYGLFSASFYLRGQIGQLFLSQANVAGALKLKLHGQGQF